MTFKNYKRFKRNERETVSDGYAISALLNLFLSMSSSLEEYKNRLINERKILLNARYKQSDSYAKKKKEALKKEIERINEIQKLQKGQISE